MQWLCFKTKNREEFVAKALLTMQGFEVILPYYMKTISHARKKSKIPYPLFPSYGFLLFDGNISSLNNIKYTRGIKSYLHYNDGNPKRIPNKVIKAIQCLKQEDGTYLPDPKRFETGDKVVITDGAIAGLDAIVKEKIDERRAELLVNLLGRVNKVNIESQMIERL